MAQSHNRGFGSQGTIPEPVSPRQPIAAPLTPITAPGAHFTANQNATNLQPAPVVVPAGLAKIAQFKF